jgi:hypothetical protein
MYMSQTTTQKEYLFLSPTLIRLTRPRLLQSGTSLNYSSASNTYITATVFSLAYPYGTISILSSYSFTTYDQGAPNGGTLCSLSSQKIHHVHLNRSGNVLWDRRCEWLSMSAPLASLSRNGTPPSRKIPDYISDPSTLRS